jgi:hypothetical protein
LQRVFHKRKYTSMPTFVVFRCAACACAVQRHVDCTDSDAESLYIGEDDAHSLQLAANRPADFCRGQGSFYATQRPEVERAPAQYQHNNFQGFFRRMCCFCALKGGLTIDSFNAVGCYDCKRRRQLVFKEFLKLKNKTGGSDIHARSLWAGLPDSLIDHICAMAIGGGSV